MYNFYTQAEINAEATWIVETWAHAKESKITAGWAIGIGVLIFLFLSPVVGALILVVSGGLWAVFFNRAKAMERQWALFEMQYPYMATYNPYSQPPIIQEGGETS